MRDKCYCSISIRMSSWYYCLTLGSSSLFVIEKRKKKKKINRKVSKKIIKFSKTEQVDYKPKGGLFPFGF